jgi:hypothetical protein
MALISALIVALSALVYFFGVLVARIRRSGDGCGRNRYALGHRPYCSRWCEAEARTLQEARSDLTL